MSYRGDAINPSYYKEHPSGIEVIQLTEYLPFALGTALKYVCRAGGKENALEDYKKSRWYLQREGTDPFVYLLTFARSWHEQLKEYRDAEPDPLKQIFFDALGRYVYSSTEWDEWDGEDADADIEDMAHALDALIRREEEVRGKEKIS